MFLVNREYNCIIRSSSMVKQEKDLTDKQRIGALGENIAGSFLRNRGFEILDKNYRKKWGEIDIVAKKKDVFRFVEVKTVKLSSTPNVSRETFGSYRPEENVHPQKLRRIHRAIQTYLLEKKIDADWQIDVVTVRLDMGKRLARIEIIENIVN